MNLTKGVFLAAFGLPLALLGVILVVNYVPWHALFMSGLVAGVLCVAMIVFLGVSIALGEDGIAHGPTLLASVAAASLAIWMLADHGERWGRTSPRTDCSSYGIATVVGRYHERHFVGVSGRGGHYEDFYHVSVQKTGADTPRDLEYGFADWKKLDVGDEVDRGRCPR